MIKNKIKEIQKIPVADSPHNDAFEAIVELYYQVFGYITSSGKWFWVWETGKKQRGYQDIDVLAVDGNELIIVSVTTCLDDKLRCDKLGKLKKEMLTKLCSYFSRVVLFLEHVDKYKWLTKKKIKRVVAYIYSANDISQVYEALKTEKIMLLSAEDMIFSIKKYLDDNDNIKIQNQMLRTIMVLNQKVKKQSNESLQRTRD